MGTHDREIEIVRYGYSLGDTRKGRAYRDSRAFVMAEHSLASTGVFWQPDGGGRFVSVPDEYVIIGQPED